MTVPLGHSKEKDVNVFFEAVRQKIRAKSLSELHEFKSLKLKIWLIIKLYKPQLDGTNHTNEWWITHIQSVLMSVDDVENALTMQIDDFLERIEKHTREGSGWIVERVISMIINISKYEPLRGG